MTRARSMSILVASTAFSLAAFHAGAQSINLRFGTAATTPASSYAAAGLAGAWNSLVMTPEYTREPLVGRNGSPISARYYQAGNASLLTFNNPLTTGNDEKLMDSMLLSTNSPTDGCFWFEGLQLGRYEVTIYAMTPNNPSLMNRTRVDNAVEAPVMVGGTWPGHHQVGVTYSRFTVTTTDGVIGFHDGLAGGFIQSGMNGVQLRYIDGCDSPILTANPASNTSCRTGLAAFSVAASGTSPFTYQWQIETTPGQWLTLGNDPGPMPCGGSAFATPVNSPTVSIGVRTCRGPFHIRAIVTNSCGSATSTTATLTLCVADVDNGTGTGVCDGGVTIDDLLYYLRIFENGSLSADVDDGTGTGTPDGGVTIDDLLYYLQRFEAGC